MDANNRREKILEVISRADKPITGSELALLLGVTRQIVVQDIALLKAGGQPLLSTVAGYIYLGSAAKNRCLKVFTCYHKTLPEAEVELKMIVRQGGLVRDVIVDHPIYGEITGSLMLGSLAAVESWLQRVRASRSLMLTTITDGIHMHTVEAADEETLNQIESALRNAGLLYEKAEATKQKEEGNSFAEYGTDQEN
ncbi:MAG: transcription repressor NadR [Negativicutes bacterium]|nr:transcription repressor NadR [Negativicutes bacterium]